MRVARFLRALRYLAAAVLLAGLANPARAASPDSPTVGTLFNWYYATSFGTGLYEFNDTTVTAVNAPVRFTMREPTETEWGWRLTAPVVAALGNFNLYDPEFGQFNRIHLAAASVMPGAELVMPLQPHWRLNGFANIGRAWEFQTGANATIYRAGLSTHYRFQSLRDPDLEIGAKYTYAGYRANGQYTEPISVASLGIASSMPLPWSVSKGRQTRLALHLIGTSYLTEVRFRLPIGYTELYSELESGLSLIASPGFDVLGASFDRIGLSYVMGNNGLRGVRLVTEFPF